MAVLAAHDVLAAVLVEALVAGVIHRQVVGDDARHLELGKAADPTGRLEDHQAVEDDGARRGPWQREAQRPDIARVAARARKVARPVSGGRAGEGVGTRPLLPGGEIAGRCHAAVQCCRPAADAALVRRQLGLYWDCQTWQCRAGRHASA